MCACVCVFKKRVYKYVVYKFHFKKTEGALQNIWIEGVVGSHAMKPQPMARREQNAGATRRILQGQEGQPPPTWS